MKHKVPCWLLLFSFLCPSGKLFLQEVPKATPHNRNAFFALCMDTADEKKRTIAEQAEMLHELGFDGVAHLWLDQLEERIDACQKNHLTLQQVYFSVDMSLAQPYDSRLKEKLPLLKGMKTQLALLINGGKPSDTSLDDRAVETIGDILALCEPNEVQVVLYPHVHYWCEKVSDCVRLAKRFPPGKIGVMFNLCHWIAIDEEKNLTPLLESAIPYPVAVSINGTDSHDEIVNTQGNWLQPLDSGSYNLVPLFQILKTLDYRGPIGLQCYGIPGDTKEHLERSMKKWKTLITIPPTAVLL